MLAYQCGGCKTWLQDSFSLFLSRGAVHVSSCSFWIGCDLLDQWSIEEGLEQVMGHPFGPLTMLAFQRPLLQNPFPPSCEKPNPHEEAMCRDSVLFFGYPTPGARQMPAEDNLEAPDIVKKRRTTQPAWLSG